MRFIKHFTLAASLGLILGPTSAHSQSTEPLGPPTPDQAALESLRAAKQTGPAIVYTLPDCIRKALNQNATLLSNQQDIKAAEARVMSARSALYPTITSGFQADMEDPDVLNQQNRTTPSGFDDDWNINVTISRSIFSGGVIPRRIQNAEIQKEIQIINTQEQINNIIAQTRNAFYLVLINQSDIEVREQQVELLRKEVDRQKALFDAGQTTRFNIVRTEVRLANELPGLEAARNQLRTSKLNLAEIMGVSGDSEFEVKGQLDCPPLETDSKTMISRALTRSPILDRLDKQILAEKLNSEIAQRWWVPQVNLFAADVLRQDPGQGPNFFNNRNQATFGLTGSWTWFDGFAGQGGSKAAEAARQNFIIQREDQVRRIENGVRRAILNLRQATISLRGEDSSIRLAEESVDLARASVEAGFSTPFDILQATVDLADTKNRALQARLKYHQALAEIDRILYNRVNFQEESESSVP